MRTANNTNNYTVEGLVAKYRNFVKENTPKVPPPAKNSFLLCRFSVGGGL